MWNNSVVNHKYQRNCVCSNSTDQDVLVLEINLRNSISQLYPSQHCSEQGDTIRLEFDLELVDHVSHAVSQTFNFDKVCFYIILKNYCCSPVVIRVVLPLHKAKKNIKR